LVTLYDLTLGSEQTIELCDILGVGELPKLIYFKDDNTAYTYNGKYKAADIEAFLKD
jgi:hypothetical protein